MWLGFSKSGLSIDGHNLSGQMSVCIYIIQVQSCKLNVTLLNKSNAGHFNLIKPTFVEKFRNRSTCCFCQVLWKWECNMIGDQEDIVECWAPDTDRLPLTYFNHISMALALVDITSPQHKHHLPLNNPRKDLFRSIIIHGSGPWGTLQPSFIH